MYMSQVKSYHNQTILFSYTRQIYEMAGKKITNFLQLQTS